ncbi:MAG: 2Fe-2S iron-sulfur cluster binding domain-containing protein [Streptosporangiales bacterium]|nr:2Fe-2S iron-sulfur cluster binding domain-containing protein [Streptosporangiales bacterium]
MGCSDQSRGSSDGRRTTLTFTLNGERVELEDVEYSQTLLEVLRDFLDLFGVKASCEVQVCGACTVLVDGAPVSSCCTLAADVDGHRVTTVEGLATEAGLHPVQQAFVDNFAVQCGYCIPGMVMSAVAFVAEESGEADLHTRKERLREFMNGNYCRCTGYEPILRAITSGLDRPSGNGAKAPAAWSREETS